MEDVIENICEKLNIDLFDWFVKPRAGRPGVLNYELIESLLIYSTGRVAIKHLGYSSQTFNRGIARLFPEVKLQGGGETWSYYLLLQSDYKQCGSCDNIKPRNQFTTDNHRPDLLSRECRLCKEVTNATWYSSNKEYHVKYLEEHRGSFNAHTAKRRAMLKNAIPPWADLGKIKEIYKNCPEGCHVDHIIPLQGEYVCGLHIETNLQYLTIEENLSKNNKFKYWWQE